MTKEILYAINCRKRIMLIIENFNDNYHKPVFCIDNVKINSAKQTILGE